jgi:hypothetical protein
MKKCRPFLEGLPAFDLITDHRPLIPILNEYSLDKLDNPRLLRLRLQMTRFIFTAKWVPGKINVEAEALSRAPVERASEADELAEGPRTFRAKGALIGLIAGSPNQSPDLNLKAVQLAADADPVMTSLRETIIAGFPNDKCNLPEQLQPFWKARHQLAIDEDDGTTVMGPRVVIPRSMVRQTIQVLLGMHQGASKMRQRARLSVLWPEMNVDIANAAAACDSCNSRLASQPKETIRHHEPATRPFEFLHADMGEDKGRHFLVIVDQFSGWPHFTMFQNKITTARRLIDEFRSFFVSIGGAPIKIWSDNGLFPAAEFQDFLRDWKVGWESSSPHYPQSNRRAEAGIKAIKALVAGSRTGGTFDQNKMAKALSSTETHPAWASSRPHN